MSGFACPGGLSAKRYRVRVSVKPAAVRGPITTAPPFDRPGVEFRLSDAWHRGRAVAWTRTAVLVRGSVDVRRG